jgi:hypothetical protein
VGVDLALKHLRNSIGEYLMELTIEQALQQGKKQGVSGDKVDALEAPLTPTTQVNEPKLTVQKKSLTFSEKRKKLAENKI